MTCIHNTQSNCSKGFTLVEVLVGLLVIVGFISIAMQAFVTATVFKVKGQELSEATTWIQEDLELIRYKANRLDYVVHTDPTQSTYNPDGSACQGTSATTGYADRLRDDMHGVDLDAPVVINKASASGNRPYTLTRNVILPNTAPYNVLTLDYQVTSAEDTLILSRRTKVIPDASLACP